MKDAMFFHIVMTRLRRACLLSILMLMVSPAGLPAGTTHAQEREYVIAVDDQLDIQVFNQVQLLSNFSTKARVRSDYNITMPWLGDVKAAGFKKSSFTKLLESEALLGKFLTDPHVTITPSNMAPTIRIVISGIPNVGTVEQEVERDTRFGQLVPALQQYGAPIDGLMIKSAEGEVFAPTPSMRLQWGDEIAFPADEDEAETPSEGAASAQQPILPPVAQFTNDEYQEFEAFLLQEDQAAYELLKPLIQNDADGVSIDLSELTEEQRNALPEPVIQRLQRQAPAGTAAGIFGFSLLGIRVNLKAPGLLEAFLGVPEPDGSTVIRVFYTGDVVQAADGESEEVVLFEIDPARNQVILQQGDLRQPISQEPPFSEIELAGIVANRLGEPEAILEQTPATASAAEDVLMQRKRYAEGQEVAPGVVLAKIVKARQMAVLQNTQQKVQVLFLRDPTKRAASESARQTAEPAQSPSQSTEVPAPAPSPATPNAGPGEDAAQQAGQPALPPQLGAVNTLSEMFFATPMF